MELTTTQIAAIVGKTERTVQRWIAEGKLKVTPGTKGRYQISADDLEALTEQDPHAEEIATLRAQVTDLQERVSQLESLTSSGQGIAPRPRSKEVTREVTRTHTHTEPLPRGLTPWRAFSRQHGIAETTAQKAIASGRLQIVEGEWKAGNTRALGALDPAGQALFFQLYHDNPNFLTCPQCPHEP
jgi:excisionase family DNA binding protein